MSATGARMSAPAASARLARAWDRSPARGVHWYRPLHSAWSPPIISGLVPADNSACTSRPLASRTSRPVFEAKRFGRKVSVLSPLLDRSSARDRYALGVGHRGGPSSQSRPSRFARCTCADDTSVSCNGRSIRAPAARARAWCWSGSAMATYTPSRTVVQTFAGSTAPAELRPRSRTKESSACATAPSGLSRYSALS